MQELGLQIAQRITEYVFLDNIYDRSIAIVFGTVFFGTFWRLWKLVQNLIFMFSFYP